MNPIYTAVRWSDDRQTECPEVRLCEDIDFAADWLLYPWLGDYTDAEMEVFTRKLKGLQELKLGKHEHLQILNLTVVR